MRPFIIGIGGAHSGSGKTSLACSILESLDELKGWGAIKFTRTALYSAVVDDPEMLGEKGKDTERLLSAGAAAVVWVQSTPEDLPETMGIAVDRLSLLPGIVVEGNSAIEVLKPDIVIFITKEPGRMKHGSLGVLGMADLVVYGTAPPAETPPGAHTCRGDDREGCLQFVSEAIRTWKMTGSPKRPDQRNKGKR